MSQENSINNNINRILVEFDVIIDTDLAIMKLIQEKYNNPKFIDQNIMSLSLHDIKEELLNRVNESPLSVCVYGIDNANSLYKELTNNNYSDILEYQSPTGIFKLMEVYHNNDNMKVTILCSSQEEVDIIKSYGDFTTLIKKREDVDLNDYDVLFLKSIHRIFEFNKENMTGKHIFVMGYKYNLMEDDNGNLLPNPLVVRPLLPHNRVGIVDVYPVEDKILIRRNNKNIKMEETENAD
jgi:hypothetical protein